MNDACEAPGRKHRAREATITVLGVPHCDECNEARLERAYEAARNQLVACAAAAAERLPEDELEAYAKAYAEVCEACRAGNHAGHDPRGRDLTAYKDRSELYDAADCKEAVGQHSQCLCDVVKIALGLVG